MPLPAMPDETTTDYARYSTVLRKTAPVLILSHIMLLPNLTTPSRSSCRSPHQQRDKQGQPPASPARKSASWSVRHAHVYIYIWDKPAASCSFCHAHVYIYIWGGCGLWLHSTNASCALAHVQIPCHYRHYSQVPQMHHGHTERNSCFRANLLCMSMHDQKEKRTRERDTILGVSRC